MAKEKKGTIRDYLKRHSFIVVFLVALIIAVTNYLVYPLFISRDLKLVEIPIANESLAEGTLITEEMLSSVSIAADLLPGGIYLDKTSVIGTYVKLDTTIPKNGFFYAESLTEEAEVMGNAYSKLNEGEYAYTISVPAKYDQNEALKDGQYVNFYFHCEYELEDEPHAVIYGMLSENTRIIGITDLEDSRHVTLALSEEDLSYFTIAEHFAQNYKGGIYPSVYYGSSGEPDYIKTNYYDITNMRFWLKERAVVYEYPESIKDMLKEGGTIDPDEMKEVENLSDGGNTLN